LSQEEAQRIARDDHPTDCNTENVRGENCKELEGMWTDHGKHLRDSSQCSNKAERERGLANTSKEFEKA
jgi:hypothetical protein